MFRLINMLILWLGHVCTLFDRRQSNGNQIVTTTEEKNTVNIVGPAYGIVK